MRLLRVVAPARVSDSFQLRLSSARVAVSTPEESYDTASPFRGRKSRLRADCCNTTAPPAIGAPQGLHWRFRGSPQNASEKFVSPHAAGLPFPRNAGKNPRPGLHPPTRKPPTVFLARPRAASTRH